MVHLMSAGRIRYVRAGREGPEDAGVPAALRRRRRARPHRGRAGRSAPACGCCAPDGGRGGARPPRPRGRHADAGDAGADPRRATRGGSTRCSATSGRSPASAGRGRTRSSTWRGSRRTRSRRQLDAEETERLANAIRGELDARPRAAAGRARRTPPSTASTTGSASRARTVGTPLARVDFEEHTIYYCPHLPDRRPGAQGPAHVEAPAVTIEQAHEATEELLDAIAPAPAAAHRGAHAADARAARRDRRRARRCSSPATTRTARSSGRRRSCTYRVSSGLKGRIEDVIVDSSARGQGVGEALVREVHAPRERGAGADARADVDAVPRVGEPALQASRLRAKADQRVRLVAPLGSRSVIRIQPHRGGWLEVVCGPMFSGKSEELIRRLRRAEIAGQRALIVKPAVDDRYDVGHVVSHAGAKMRAVTRR